MVLLSGGISTRAPTTVSASAVNFAPRVKVPVLMVNGTYDAIFPAESHVEPLFRLFGAADNDKKLVWFPSGHFPLEEYWVPPTLEWLDRYLGPVG